MTDIVTAATKVAKRLVDSDDDSSTAELAETVVEATEDEQSDTSQVKRYAKKAAVLGAVALAQRVLSENERMNANEGIDEDATRVEVVDPDERVSASDTSGSKSESEESSGGLFSLKRVLFLGALAGVGYAAVKKFRSKNDQHTLEKWDESASSDTATVGDSDASEADVDIGAGVADDEVEHEDVSDHDVDIGAGEADDESASNTTTDPTEVGDNEAADVEDNEAIGVDEDDDSVGADPDEVAVEEDAEDEDEDERLSQSE